MRELGQLAVGDGDVIPDAGAAQALPVQQDLHHLGQLQAIGTRHQGLGQLFQRPFFVGGLHLGQNAAFG